MVSPGREHPAPPAVAERPRPARSAEGRRAWPRGARGNGGWSPIALAAVARASYLPRRPAPPGGEERGGAARGAGARRSRLRVPARALHGAERDLRPDRPAQAQGGRSSRDAETAGMLPRRPEIALPRRDLPRLDGDPQHAARDPRTSAPSAGARRGCACRCARVREGASNALPDDRVRSPPSPKSLPPARVPRSDRRPTPRGAARGRLHR